MELTIKQPTILKKEKATNGKIIQFFSAEGVKKVFDVHQYSKTGTIFFKRKKKKPIVFCAVEY